jgi:hypothetical protein
MFVVDLACAAGHKFEGWYDTSQQFERERSQGALTCPLCGDAHIERILSTGGILSTWGRRDPGRRDPGRRDPGRRDPGPRDRPATRPDVKPPSADVAPDDPKALGPPKMPLDVQKALARVVQWVRRTHEDVGAEFAARARAINQGQEEARRIYGSATPDEEKQLEDDGVPFLKLPIPDIEQS